MRINGKYSYQATSFHSWELILSRQSMDLQAYAKHPRTSRITQDRFTVFLIPLSVRKGHLHEIVCAPTTIRDTLEGSLQSQMRQFQRYRRTHWRVKGSDRVQSYAHCNVSFMCMICEIFDKVQFRSMESDVSAICFGE